MSSGEWILTRISARLDDPFQLAVDNEVQADVQYCEYCKGFYGATGHVPLACPDCGRRRDANWVARIETAARYALGVKP